MLSLLLPCSGVAIVGMGDAVLIIVDVSGAAAVCAAVVFVTHFGHKGHCRDVLLQALVAVVFLSLL